MNGIIEYENYRRYMQDFYLARRGRSCFSWREFSKAAGYASPVFLKLVCEEKANLSEAGVERVAEAMGLAGKDREYFRMLVRFNQEKNPKKKKQFWAELRELAAGFQVKLVGEHQYDYYQSWKNSALRELVPALPEASAAELASCLISKTSASEVKKAIELLANLGFLTKNPEGKWVQSDHSISTGNFEIAPLAVRDMHRQMAELAVAAVDEVPRDERDISGLTLGVTEDAFHKISGEIAEFRRRVVAIATEDAGLDRVYRLNLQLFPLTRKVKKLNGGEENA
ncbi:MAG: TIGR02147 family protein [Fibrobacter sp.]|jgi:uncharacterized protein (TIGR02147 family)|nr:TIGR02147 family protein [Fibrobacter sp.]